MSSYLFFHFRFDGGLRNITWTFRLTDQWRSTVRWTALYSRVAKGNTGSLSFLPSGPLTNTPSFIRNARSQTSSLTELAKRHWQWRQRLWRHYEKQTGPISRPNAWSSAPISTIAISTTGSRWVFSVLNSNTVRPQVSCFNCKKTIRKCIIIRMFYF